MARNGDIPSKNQSNMIRTMATKLPNWRGKVENKEELHESIWPPHRTNHYKAPLSLVTLSAVFLEWMNRLINLTQLEVYYVCIIRCVFFQHGLPVC